MNISTKAIVSNSEMIKNYKACREKAESLGKIFVLKNNQPDAVLMPISEYEKYSVFIEYMENLDENEIIKLTEFLSKEEGRKLLLTDLLKNDIQ
ncbi:MAG: hypothetical protein WBJ13_07780 [Sedimentibacter sp.]